MKRVKMKTTMAGPDGCAAPNQEIAVDDAMAEALVKGGYADYVPEKATKPLPVPAEPEPMIETADIRPVETAETAVVRPAVQKHVKSGRR